MGLFWTRVIIGFSSSAGSCSGCDFGDGCLGDGLGDCCVVGFITTVADGFGDCGGGFGEDGVVGWGPFGDGFGDCTVICCTEFGDGLGDCDGAGCVVVVAGFGDCTVICCVGDAGAVVDNFGDCNACGFGD